MALPISNLITQRDTTAYDTYGFGRKSVKTLKSGSAFRIDDARRHNGQFWVKSGAGDWYQFDGSLFRFAAASYGGGALWITSLVRNGVRGDWLVRSRQQGPSGAIFELHRIP